MKSLVVLSGGQDSTTCLALAIRDHGRENVFAVTFDYGQRHRVEIAAAATIANLAGISSRHEIILVQNVLRGTSPLVNKDSQVEQYSSAEALPGGLEKTFVPMRNTLFLTIAANRAVLIAMQTADKNVELVTGLSQEDYGGYPDCRQAFVNALGDAFESSLDDAELPQLLIVAPLMTLSKRLTVELSETMAPYSRTLLAYSHTCYNGEVPPCGHCHACLLRAKGYAEAGVVDPLVERLVHERPDYHPQ